MKARSDYIEEPIIRSIYRVDELNVMLTNCGSRLISIDISSSSHGIQQKELSLPLHLSIDSIEKNQTFHNLDS